MIIRAHECVRMCVYQIAHRHTRLLHSISTGGRRYEAMHGSYLASLYPPPSPPPPPPPPLTHARPELLLINCTLRWPVPIRQSARGDVPTDNAIYIYIYKTFLNSRVEGVLGRPRMSLYRYIIMMDADNTFMENWRYFTGFQRRLEIWFVSFTCLISLELFFQF